MKAIFGETHCCYLAGYDALLLLLLLLQLLPKSKCKENIISRMVARVDPASIGGGSAAVGKERRSGSCGEIR